MRKVVICTTTVCVLFTFVSAVAQPFGRHGEPCPVRTAPSGWLTYVDRLHGFCFSYPPTYERVAKPWLQKYTLTSDTLVTRALRKDAQEGRLLRLQNKRDKTVSIIVLLENKPFNLESFVAEAPTGIETPPEPRQLGTEMFYYYGPGGGGVAYPDGYFFNLKGKTLTITFDGPYINDKTPSQETKNIEEQLLQTFRTF